MHVTSCGTTVTQHNLCSDLRKYSNQLFVNSIVATFRSISTSSPKGTRNFDTAVNTNSEISLFLLSWGVDVHTPPVVAEEPGTGGLDADDLADFPRGRLEEPVQFVPRLI